MGTLNFLDRLSFPFALSLCLCLCLCLWLPFSSQHHKKKSKVEVEVEVEVNSSTIRLPHLISPNSLSKVTFSRVSSLDRPCHTEIDSSRFFYGGKFCAFFFSCFVYKLCCLVPEKILGGKFKFCWFFWPIDKVPGFLC